MGEEPLAWEPRRPGQEREGDQERPEEKEEKGKVAWRHWQDGDVGAQGAGL